MQGLNWDLIWDHGPFSFSTFWGSSKISCEITGLFDDFVARFSSLISELHSLRPPLRPPLKGTPAFAPDSAHYAPTFATKICLKIIKNPGSHNFFWDPQCWKTEGPGLIYKKFLMMKKHSRFNFCSIGKTKKVVILPLVSKTAGKKTFTIYRFFRNFLMWQKYENVAFPAPKFIQKRLVSF